MYVVGMDNLNLHIRIYSTSCIHPLIDRAYSSSNSSNSKIREIIFGSMLGDGSIEMQERSINGRFKFSQSVKNNGYFLMVYELFSPYCKALYRNYEYLDKRTKEKYTTLSFSTVASPLFTEFYTLFYLNGVKIIPYDLSLLTAIALAHWIMQDGSYHIKSGGIYLCTDIFNPNDVIRLAKYLQNTFGLKCTTPKAPDKGGLRIYISKTSLPLIKDLVIPHMHLSMHYKLGL